jgi:4-amino-4-deoxy-L-arabinose transferase-like glycosyltransferase
VAVLGIRRRAITGRFTVSAAQGRYAVPALLCCLLAIRVGLSLVMIARPGLQYDETLFVNAATLRVPGIFLVSTFHGIPLFLMPYIGALKAWLYDPIFAVFGTSATTIRAPAVVITSLGVLLAYFAVRDLVNRPVAIAAFAGLCFDDSVFWLTRDDVGPSAIEFFLKCAAMWCAARFARRPSVRWVVLLLVTLGLGVFNKLNFIWVVNSAAAISLLVGIRHWRSLRSLWRPAAVWVVGLAVIYALFALYYVHNNIGATGGAGLGGGLGQSWSSWRNGITSVLSGTWFYGYALAPIAIDNGVVVGAYLLLFAVGAVACGATARFRNLPLLGTAVAAVLMAAQIKLTAQATAGWHYVAIYPFVTIVAAYGAFVLASAVGRGRTATFALLACAVGVALAYDGVIYGKSLSNIASKEPSNVAWSPAIYRLDDFVQHSNATIFTADWGILNPLYALHPSGRFVELTFQLMAPTPASLQQVAGALASTSGPRLIITHAPARAVFPETTTSLHSALGPHLHLFRTLDGRDGKPVFEVYRYR